MGVVGQVVYKTLLAPWVEAGSTKLVDEAEPPNKRELSVAEFLRPVQVLPLDKKVVWDLVVNLKWVSVVAALIKEMA